MKTHPVIKKTLFALGALLLAAAISQGQLPQGGTPGGINAALMKLFGNVTAFTAKGEIEVLDQSQKQTMSMPMDFALFEKKIRFATDMMQMKSKEIPPGALDNLKQMGMTRVISVVRPDKQLIYIIYPDQKCYLNMSLSKEEAAAAEKTPKVEKTELSKETIDGHACAKNKVVIKDDSGQTLEAITWNASDLKDFLVQIQTQEKSNTMRLHFQQVQLSSPEPKDFEPPAGYTQYNDQQELILALMKKGLPKEEKK